MSLPDGIEMGQVRDQLQSLWEQAVAVWVAGGWGMVAIAVNAIVLFGLGVHVQLRLREKRFLSVRESTWRRWIDQPGERRGPIGDLLDTVTATTTLQQAATVFQGLRVTESAPIERDLKVMSICVGTAPLLGLFGTVTGMLATFAALAKGSGGDQTMGMIAKGISEALITTETGLVVALPGLFFQYRISRMHQRHKVFLAHLESVWTQILHRRLKAAGAAA